jgi:uncharacterized protein (TIGR02118 family)
MHKLVILIESIEDWQSFEAEWPKFLHLAESMPGLKKEAISQIDPLLYGNKSYMKMYELFFDTKENVERALSSSVGQEAGKLLQNMTQGKMMLFIAKHQEDDLTNIRKYKKIKRNV